MSSPRSPYLPCLDGLRAASILLVIVAHLINEKLAPGGFGVTLFFFISGYLITGQLVGEIERKSRLDFKNFYTRRFLRLMPASLAYIFVGGIFYVLMGGTITLGGWLAALLYGGNYYDQYVGYSMSASGINHPFNIIWSLAVEEHFYFLWPTTLVLLYTRGRSQIFWVVLGTCLVEVLWRTYMFDRCLANGPLPSPFCGVNVDYRLYKGTDTRLDSIAWGGFLAVLPLSRAGTAVALWLQKRWVQVAAALALLSTFAIRDYFFREVIRYTVQGAALVVLIQWLLRIEDHPFKRLLESRPALFIGRLSYSIYLWHWLAVGIADAVFTKDTVAWSALALALTAPFAVGSYYLIERPMLDLRRRFGSNARDVPSAA